MSLPRSPAEPDPSATINELQVSPGGLLRLLDIGRHFNGLPQGIAVSRGIKSLPTSGCTA